jgi:hypothetical protein
MRKTALTAFGLVGTDWVRMTMAFVDGVGTLFVRADGTNSIVPVLPTAFRTSGDIANVTATLGHRVNMAAVPSVALPNHTWKGTFDLDGIAAKFGVEDRLEALRASYADEAELAA